LSLPGARSLGDAMTADPGNTTRSSLSFRRIPRGPFDTAITRTDHKADDSHQCSADGAGDHQRLDWRAFDVLGGALGIVARLVNSGSNGIHAALRPRASIICRPRRLEQIALTTGSSTTEPIAKYL
jgi:hypothetical protein